MWEKVSLAAEDELEGTIGVGVGVATGVLVGTMGVEVGLNAVGDGVEEEARVGVGTAYLNQSQGGNYILERWQRHGRCKHQCVGSGL